MGDVERERARWRQWCIDLVRDALRELAGDPTDEDISAWLDRREQPQYEASEDDEAPGNPVPGESVDGEKLPF